MGGFPSHIKPIVYGWPTGGQATFMKCQEQFARSPDVHRDFAIFIEGLLKAKVSKVHILAHSMGARMFSGAIHLLKDVFVHVDTSTGRHKLKHHTASLSEGPRTSLPLGSVVLLHLEADLDQFVKHDFAVSCPHQPAHPSFTSRAVRLPKGISVPHCDCWMPPAGDAAVVPKRVHVLRRARLRARSLRAGA